jgi:integrase/recombinase XerD
MELHFIKTNNGKLPVLLDGEMKIVKPVYEYMKKLRSDNKSPNTITANARDLKIYWDFLSHNFYQYDEITPRHIQEFREFLFKDDPYDNTSVLYQESKRTPGTVNRILSTIYNFYKYFGNIQEVDNPIIMQNVKRGFNAFKGLLDHVRKNDTTVKSIFKVKDLKKDYNILTSEQINSVYNAINNKRDQLIWLILAETGARIQEVLGLKVENIPYVDSTETMSILKQVKSKGKYRDIMIPTYVLEQLDSYIMEERDKIDVEHDYIFVALDKRYLGKPLSYSSIYQSFKKIENEVGFKFNFHDLRHTYSTNLIEEGFDISIVNKLVGHNHISTTQKYIHTSKKHLIDVLKGYWERKGQRIGLIHDDELTQR